MSEVDQLINRARQQLAQSHIDGAIDSLRRALSLDPDLAESHAILALCLVDARRLHAAGHEARLALLAEPNLGLAHYALTHVLIGQRKFKQAEAQIERFS